ncbi:MAG: hypothetical protein ABL984_00175 [Pyrinomonadaceae bacterium]
MLSNASILTTLIHIEGQYNAAIAPMDNFYSKLAILEACGWIEEAMDDVLERSMNYKIKKSKDVDFVSKKILENYGFDYSGNFRKVLTYILGLWNIGKMERRLDPLKFARLVSQLGNLKQVRDSAAHTHVQVGITQYYDGPSVTRQRLLHVTDGLADIEQVLISMKLTKL